MQGLDSKVKLALALRLINLNVPQRTLTDIRDSKTYQVRKLADGNIWMTQNLALINYELKPSDSDVDSNWTLPNTTSGTGYDIAYVYVDNTYGGYYSWTAATAGTGTTSVTSGNAPSSICSRGWRLPTSIYNAGDFENLRDNYYSSSVFGDNWTISPLNFTLSGYRSNNNINDQSSAGLYWSSSTNHVNYAYSLALTDTHAIPGSGYGKYNGFSVRCLAK